MSTPNLGLEEPVVGGDDDAWGAKLNTDLDVIDAVFNADGTGTSVGLNVGVGNTIAVGGTLRAGGTVDAHGASVILRADSTNIQDAADATKIARFDASAITTATLRTFTLPDASTVLAGLSVANSFTDTQTVTKTSAGVSTTALEIKNASSTAGTEVNVDLNPTSVGAGTRSAQIAAKNDGSNSITLVFRVSSGSTPAAALTVNPNKTLQFNGYTAGTLVADSSGNVSAASASTMRNSLGLVIGTNVQAWDADLDAVAALSSPATSISGAAQTASNGSDFANAATVRTNLGLAIGTNVQAQSANLSAIAGLTTASDTLTYWTGSGAASTSAFTAAGRALVDDADAATQRTTLGLGTSATVNTGTSGATLPFLNGTNTWAAAQTFTTAPVFINQSGSRTALGLGTIATQASSAVTITGGSVTGITDIVVADGGTGVSTLTGIVKGNGTAAFTAATAGTDYYAPGSTDVALADGGTGSSTAAGARTNLGLGTSATVDTGTSGATIPLLNGANTHSGFTTFTNFVSVAGPANISIAAGVVTATHSSIEVDTEGGAASDDLDTINGGTVSGTVIIIKSTSAARVVTAKDGTGNLSLAGDMVLDHPNDRLMLIYHGTLWCELSRSNNN